MAKRAGKKARKRKSSAPRRTGKHTSARRQPKSRRSAARRAAPKTRRERPQKRRKQTAKPARPARRTPPRLERDRRVLTDPVPASSLDEERFKGAARSGRKALDRSLHEHSGMTPAITGGDLDADWENAYFSGDEAPGGDNLTPDQEDVEEMGAALGLSYNDSEELKGGDKVIERDKHRWELDPASADDYRKDRE